ncbi:kinase-like domain-containing protein [Gloeopeniophorella convolvens]|nr:kinase-like domain-containing protein [Gloeopeniophorella convolvens]
MAPAPTGERGRSPTKVQQSPSSSRSSGGSPSSLVMARGRSRIRKLSDDSDPFSEENLRRRGYHSLKSFDQTFHVEKRWKLVREMGSGAYGVVISAADEISGETVAIKMVTRIFAKTSLAKRALRELTLLRHFSNHENITGLIDVDGIAESFNEMYLFMEACYTLIDLCAARSLALRPADLHQIIKSGQTLTNEHVQYFTYQILRGMKYVHSASVVHRDLKPGNLLVNSDCDTELQVAYSRSFSLDGPYLRARSEHYELATPHFSNIVTSRLAMLNKILEVLGTPSNDVLKRIASERAQAYVRSLPIRRKVSFKKLILMPITKVVSLILSILAKALAHPWLAAYHDVNDEPSCPTKFDRWREIEELETIEQFRAALWAEINDYRREYELPSVLSEEGILPPQNEDLGPEAIRERLHSTSTSPVNERSSVDGRARPRTRDPLVSYARRTSVYSARIATRSSSVTQTASLLL